MAARRPVWKWHRWKSIGFCLWPPSTCIWNLKLKFQSKLDLCSGNHVVYRQTDRRTDGRTRWIQYTPPPTSLGEGIIILLTVAPVTGEVTAGWRWQCWTWPVAMRTTQENSLIILSFKGPKVFCVLWNLLKIQKSDGFRIMTLFVNQIELHFHSTGTFMVSTDSP